MQEPESVLEDETQEIHWDFAIKSYHLISASILGLVLINKKE